MTKEEYNTKTKDLFERWQKDRPEFKEEGKRFSIDGIMDFDNWLLAKPKILFLLKENHVDEDNWEPSQGINTEINIISKNIARWTQIFRDLYDNPNAEPSFNDIILPLSFNDIAIIEVKKLNEGKNNSTHANLKRHARKDKLFIQEQFELINPQIIICGYTGDIYGDIIYEEEPWDKNIISNSKCTCYKHRDRLVIDFYHPSTRSGRRDMELFEILCKLIKDGKVFEQFSWNRSNNQILN